MTERLAPTTRLPMKLQFGDKPLLTRHLWSEYYEQRACFPGTLLVSEGTFISHSAASAPHVAGIWSPAHVNAWRHITDLVHARGCKIFCQLWHMGRGGSDQVLAAGGFSLLSSVAEPIAPGYPVPKAMTEEDIQQTIQDYVKAATNAIEAGFDGVEIHGANGYLLDQFLQDVCNKRTDHWGGSIENRARFHLEVTRAVLKAIGSSRTAIRLSPYSDYQGMLMDDPVPTYKYLLSQLKPLGLAYLHLIEARIAGDNDSPCGRKDSVGWMIHQWDNVSPVLLAGGFTAESAKEAVDVRFKDHKVAIVFGRHFISNPDLVYRIKRGMSLDKYDRNYFYTPAGPKGYIDYPYSQQFLSQPAGQ